MGRIGRIRTESEIIRTDIIGNDQDCILLSRGCGYKGNAAIQ
jgi:hypothetical protein